jgi:hypothetical protein
MSVCIPGNTDFWRNDLSTPNDHLPPGNNLFGAYRHYVELFKKDLLPCRVRVYFAFERIHRGKNLNARSHA